MNISQIFGVFFKATQSIRKGDQTTYFRIQESGAPALQ